jgi:hypothetical protein
MLILGLSTNLRWLQSKPPLREMDERTDPGGPVFTSTHLHATNQDGTSHLGAMVLQGQNSKLAEAFLLQRPITLCQLSAAFHSSDIIVAWSSLAVRGRYVKKTFSLSDGGL